MDTVTQVALGAAVGEAVGGKHIGNKALLWGGIAGFIPDLDIFPGQFMDAVTRVEFHRSVTHSIIFFLAMAPLLAIMARRIHQTLSFSFQKWTLLFFLSLLTHALLDCFTTWGTQLFWPSGYKVAFQSIFVVDPLYTIPFLVCLPWLAFKEAGSKARKRLNTAALTLSCLYLGIAGLNKFMATQAFHNSLTRQEINYQNINTRPTPFNSLLWSANVETEAGFYVGYYSLLDEKPAIDFDYYPKNHDLLNELANQHMQADYPALEKLIRITENQYTVEKGDKGLILNDLRFGQMAGWHGGASAKERGFTFSYRLEPRADGPPKIERKPLDNDIDPEVLLAFWQRIKGKAKEAD